MSAEKPNVSSESHTEKPEHGTTAPATVSAEAVITPPSQEDLEKGQEILADLHERAGAAGTEENESQKPTVETAPIQTASAPVAVPEKPKAAEKLHAASKVSLGIFGAAGVLLGFFAALFASAGEKLGKALGIKFDGGGGGGHAKPAGGHSGGGGHH